MDGTARGILPTFARGATRIASLGYGVGVSFRNRNFDAGRTPIHRCGVPVISVGNLTTGGTGKTPATAWIASLLRRNGYRVAIVSRGYGADSSGEPGTGLNDEALELYDRLPDVPQVQDPKRVDAAAIAVEELETEIVLMDDGFQHRHLHRDLDLVLIDATCPFGFGYLLPRGLLREPIHHLRRADAILMTRTDLVSPNDMQRIEHVVANHAPNVPIFRSRHRPEKLRGERYEMDTPLSDLHGADVALVSAIGNPDAFARTVRTLGANVVDVQTLPDHAGFDPETVSSLQDWARKLDASCRYVLCTHKDLVKLRMDQLGGKPLFALQIALDVHDPGDRLAKSILNTAAGGRGGEPATEPS